MLGHGVQGIPTTVDTLAGPLPVIVGNKSKNIGEPYTSGKLLVVQWCEAYQDILFKVEDKLSCLAISATKKMAQYLMGLFDFQKQHISHLNVLLCPRSPQIFYL